MAWETRGDNRYFYLSQRRSDGQVRKRYLGRGLRAEVEAMRLERKFEISRQLKQERLMLAQGEALIRKQTHSTRDIVHAMMLGCGYTNERSRGWRKLKMIASNDGAMGAAAPEQVPETAFSELVKAARLGNRSVIPALRRMMQENPDLARNNGDLAAKTAIHWVDLIAGKDLYYRECLLMRVAELRKQLTAETNGTVVEAMVVEQAVSTWLQLYHHETREATRPAESIQLGEFRLKKIESAFNRHMRSLGALSALKAVCTSQQGVRVLNSSKLDAGEVNMPKSLDELPKPALNGNRLEQVFEENLEPLSMN